MTRPERFEWHDPRFKTMQTVLPEVQPHELRHPFKGGYTQDNQGLKEQAIG
jgi:hypothetical protein